MLEHSLLINLVLLAIVLLLLRSQLHRWWKRLDKVRRNITQRCWKPASPHECPLCRDGISLSVIQLRDVMPYVKRKSARGRKKTVQTQGYACPNPDCVYCGITNDTLHALVGYGTYNSIQRFKCQSCGKVFTSRFGTPLYYLKSDQKCIEMVLWFLVEGVDASVMGRFTEHADATLARWLTRLGTHSQRCQNLGLR